MMEYKIKKIGDKYKIIYFIHGSEHSNLSFTDKEKTKKQTNDEKISCNIARAKSKIREYAMCNNWEYFVTLTLDKNKQNRYDISGYIKALGIWKSNYNKKFGANMRYLLIPEQHKDGAWHMHGLFSGIANESIEVNDKGYMDIPYYYNRFGYISLSKIKDKDKTASYITKYVSKALISTDIEVNKHSYYTSRGLETAVEIHHGYVAQMPADVWKNDYVGIEYIENEEALNKALARLEITS